jgi:hypothetical protein
MPRPIREGQKNMKFEVGRCHIASVNIPTVDILIPITIRVKVRVSER